MSEQTEFNQEEGYETIEHIAQIFADEWDKEFSTKWSWAKWRNHLKQKKQTNEPDRIVHRYSGSRWAKRSGLKDIAAKFSSTVEWSCRESLIVNDFPEQSRRAARDSNDRYKRRTVLQTRRRQGRRCQVKARNTAKFAIKIKKSERTLTKKKWAHNLWGCINYIRRSQERQQGLQDRDVQPRLSRR